MEQDEHEKRARVLRSESPLPRLEATPGNASFSTERSMPAQEDSIPLTRTLPADIQDVPLPAGHVLKQRYEIVRHLGSGGFGAVYLAHDQVLQREVALKIPRQKAIASPESLDRFLSEARIAARISHPAIVKVYDFGVEDQGHAFIVLEYINGQPLSQLLKQERLGLTEALGLAINVAEAIHCGINWASSIVISSQRTSCSTGSTDPTCRILAWRLISDPKSTWQAKSLARPRI